MITNEKTFLDCISSKDKVSDDKNKITIDIILKELTGRKRYCALVLNAHDPELLERIKEHIEIFKTLTKE